MKISVYNTWDMRYNNEVLETVDTSSRRVEMQVIERRASGGIRILTTEWPHEIHRDKKRVKTRLLALYHLRPAPHRARAPISDDGSGLSRRAHVDATRVEGMSSDANIAVWEIITTEKEN